MGNSQRATVRVMRPVLIIEQDAKLPGHGLLGDRIDHAGMERVSTDAWSDDLSALDPSDYSAIVAMGGNPSAFDIETYPWLLGVEDLLLRAIANETPVLGVCLGGQVLARALGAEVRIGDVGEYGWYEISPEPEAANDPVLAALRAPSGSLSWHRDVFELPEGATLLASSPAAPNQAFRFGASAWGLQFHPEVEPDVFDLWQSNHPGAAEITGLTPEVLKATVVKGCAESRGWRSELFDRFLAVARETAA